MTLEEITKAVEVLPTYMFEDDISCFYKYANLIHGGIICDVGTGWGKSMAVLGMANSENDVITCDPGDYPVAMNWATDNTHYTYRIQEIIRNFHLEAVVDFKLMGIQQLLPDLPQVDILHFDNWPELNGADATELLQQCIAKIKIGGYLLFRNYGRGDRSELTESADRATVGMKEIEQIGLIKVYQK
jgi:hypothetical protein